MEDRAYRIIHNKKRDQKTNFKTVRELVKKRICLQVYKCLNGNTCDVFENYFKLMKNNTRNKNCLIHLEKIKLESCRKSFFFNGAKQFNSMPVEIRSAESKNKFLKLYKEFFNV